MIGTATFYMVGIHMDKNTYDKSGVIRACLDLGMLISCVRVKGCDRLQGIQTVGMTTRVL